MAECASTTAACTAEPEEEDNKKGGGIVNNINVYPARLGGWIYEVWIAARPTVVGWCRTREAAEQEAALA